GGQPLPQPFVAIARTPDGRGYWLLRADGAAYPFGDASTSTGPASIIQGLRAPIVAGAATPTAQGFWQLAGDGGVFAFGTARFFGSAATVGLHAPIVDAASTADG